MKKNNKSPKMEKEIQVKRKKSTLKRKIKSVFQGAGFSWIPTNDHEFFIGHRRVEIDALFIYENIWLMCEDTISNNRDHIRTKNEATAEIRNNIQAFINILTKQFPDMEDVITKHSNSRIKLFSLYISSEELSISEDDRLLFSELIFVQPKTLSYFQWIVQCIKKSAMSEVFRFLGVKSADVGSISSSADSSVITAPIIYPKSFTGLTNDVRIVSFMISAEDLLRTCYVLRKDNWTESIWLYQRLIDKTKIKNIRSFLGKEGASFYNNIIVGLPDTVRFKNSKGDYKKISDISEFEDDYELILPKEYNSICVIDGQHRIFAHYESGGDTRQEKRISELRRELHLLVTGLVFPEEMNEEQRAQIQSKIFLDINSNAKPVPQNVLLQIKRIQNPISDESIAQFVIEKLNAHGIFQNKLQVSSLDDGKLKTASIVRFALRYLVTIKPTDGKQSLFTYWDGNKDALKNSSKESIEEYVDYCDRVLSEYFGAIKNNLSSQWNDDTKLLSVISINGFIIALTRQLTVNGVRDFDYYDNIFKGWNYDFSQEGFQYTSSQYRKFSTEILESAFKIDPERLKLI